MLLVKTYLDKNSIHGIGVFAGERITVDYREFDPALCAEFLTKK